MLSTKQHCNFIALSNIRRHRFSICVSISQITSTSHCLLICNQIHSSWQAAECQNHIADSVNKNFAVHAVAGNTTIEVIPHDINKSSIANRILQETSPDFVLSIGDDRSDEDMFNFLKKQKSLQKVITCTVGKRSTEANYFIPNVDGVLSLLDELCLASQ